MEFYRRNDYKEGDEIPSVHFKLSFAPSAFADKFDKISKKEFYNKFDVIISDENGNKYHSKSHYATGLKGGIGLYPRQDSAHLNEIIFEKNDGASFLKNSSLGSVDSKFKCVDGREYNVKFVNERDEVVADFCVVAKELKSGNFSEDFAHGVPLKPSEMREFDNSYTKYLAECFVSNFER